MQKNLLLVALLLAFGTGAGSAAETDAQRVDAVLPQVTAWRRDIHQHPELSNREVRTSKLVADELKKLGYSVHT
ncbi:MAG: amidohydrolase, partial [Proteobacteria bacterium]|nr:amidohydrolase [Pseudomonadota bacterium]